MKKSKLDLSLYEKYNEDTEDYRLSQDLKNHNWLVQKLRSSSTELSKKKEKKKKNKSKKTMKSQCGKATDNTERGTAKPLNLVSNKVINDKGVMGSKSNELKTSIHSLPIGTAPLYQSPRQAHGPKKPLKSDNSCSTQTDNTCENQKIIEYLKGKNITTEEKLKDLIEGSNAKMVDVPQKAITLTKLTKNPDEDDVIFVAQFMGDGVQHRVQKRISKESLQSLINMSESYKRLIRIFLLNNKLQQNTYELKASDEDKDKVIEIVEKKELPNKSNKKETSDSRPKQDTKQDNGQHVVENISHQIAECPRPQEESRNKILEQISQQVQQNAVSQVAWEANKNVAEIVGPHTVYNTRAMYLGGPAMAKTMPKPRTRTRSRNKKTTACDANVEKPRTRTETVQDINRSHQLPRSTTQGQDSIRGIHHQRFTPQNYINCAHNSSHGECLASTSVFRQHLHENLYNSNNNIIPENNCHIDRGYAYPPSGINHNITTWSPNKNDVYCSESSTFYGSNGSYYIQSVHTTQMNRTSYPYPSGPYNQLNNNYGYNRFGNQDGRNHSPMSVRGRHDPTGQSGSRCTFGSNNLYSGQHSCLSGNMQNRNQEVLGSNLHTGYQQAYMSGLQSYFGGPNRQVMPPITVGNHFYPQQQQWPARSMTNATATMGFNQVSVCKSNT